jgi:hypothetical protein
MRKTKVANFVRYQVSVDEQQMIASAIRSHRLILRKAVFSARSTASSIIGDPIAQRCYELMASALEREEEAFNNMFGRL